MKSVILFFVVLLSANIFSQGSGTKNSDSLVFNFVYPGFWTGYELQSNGTPQHIWQDKDNPQNIHAVFTHSAEVSGFYDRNGRYLFSTDMGQSWNDMGNVQVGVTARGGFPSISGLSDGRPVVGLHTNDSISATRTQIYVRNSAGTNWNRYDPGPAGAGEPIWPRVLGISNNRVVFTSSIQIAPDFDFLLNSLDLNTGTFSGWSSTTGEQAETYCLEKSTDEQIIGLAYVGTSTDSATFGDFYYIESLDGGITWSNPNLIWGYNHSGDSLGAFRGMDIIFLDDIPYVVFEVVKQDFTSGSYYVTEPNKIILWSPAINNGESLPLVQSGINIPFYPVYGSNNQFVPVCRPTIGRSAEGDALFVVFSAVTDWRYVDGNDSTSYFAGYIIYSTDAGNDWTAPQKFTPESPIKDFRYFSVSPTNSVSDGNCILQITAMEDTIPGYNPGPPWPPVQFFPEFVGITGTVPLVSSMQEPKLMAPDNFSLSQNFPNPFNPVTTVHFNVPAASEINISVYNILGEKITEVLNEFKQAGSYDIKINMETFNTGVYFYKMQSGAFTATRKMILIK